MMKLLMWLILLCSAADAAVVHLKDGSRIRGTIVAATARDVTVQTEAEARTIPSSQVSRIDYDEAAAPAVVQAPGAPVSARADVLWNELSVFLGLGAPLDRLDFGSLGGGRAGNGDVGARLGLVYLFASSRRLSFGPSFDWVHRSPSGSPGGVPFARTDVSGDTLAFMAWAKYALRPGEDVRPYLRAGLGAHRTTTVADATPETGFVWSGTGTGETRRLIDDDAWGLALGAAFGVDFGWNEAGYLGIELGWLGFQNESRRPTPAGRALGMAGSRSTLDVFSVGLRLGTRF